MLTWSRSQTGQIEFSPVKINIKTLVEEVIILLKEVVENKKIRLLTNIEDNTFVYADKNMIDTIFRNLISNAIKFTPKGGEITVRANTFTNENNKIFTEISVKDNGLGILPELQNELFEIRESTSTRGTENELGTELGLILCKEFVEKHGGNIWVESEIEKGSSFYFTIPYKHFVSSINND